MVEPIESWTDPMMLEGPYEDTVALLQAEIERLEAEVRARDEAMAREHGPPATAHETERRLAELTAELALRDETINALWEHLQRHEEAEEVARAEWSQVQELVEDLENRLAEGGPGTDGAAWRAERDRADNLQRELDDNCRQWETQRRSLEAEIQRLRHRDAEAVSTSMLSDQAAVLEAENGRLRAACERLPTLEAAAFELGKLREQIHSTEVHYDTGGKATGWGSSPSERPDQPRPAPISAADLTPDERIRALRQHLREVHEQEQEERKRSQLTARLGRIWKALGN